MKLKKIIVSILIIVLLICCFSTSVRAGDLIGTLQTNMKNANVSSGDATLQGEGIVASLNTILGLVQVAGTGVALISISLLGIKYMLASIEEKAEIKKYLVGAVIGGILVFGGLGIAKLLAKFAGEIFTAATPG